MTRKSLIEYMSKKIKCTISENLKIVQVQKLPDFVNLDFVYQKLSKIPEHLTDGLDGIYVANLEEFQKRQINAIFKDGVIYVTPNQESDEDFLDDVVHEIGHYVEEKFYDEIYGDRSLEKEFLEKRLEFKNRLKPVGFVNTKYFHDLLVTPTYSQELDDVFYKDIGYDKIREISSDIFVSPYAITSLREYWANGFENYMMYNKKQIQKTSPALYLKLKDLVEYGK